MAMRRYRFIGRMPFLMMKVETGMKQLQAPKYQELKLERVKKYLSLLKLPKFQNKNGSADTLISDSSPYNCEIINFSSFKPPNLCHSVMAAPGNNYTDQRNVFLYKYHIWKYILSMLFYWLC